LLFSKESAEIVAGDWFITVGLLLGGLITIVPLLLFASGAIRVQLSTMGILQYIAPTGQLLLATIFFKEAFGVHRAVVFCLIWFAVILYSIDAWRSSSLNSELIVEPET